MNRLLIALLLFVLVSCKTTTYYIVRHAEKMQSGTDPDLTETGRRQALDLRQFLRNKNIKHIYSTNYVRTKGTAAPLAEATGLDVEMYDPKDKGFAEGLKRIGDGNVLVVGHSNTVDDLVNALCGETKMSDLRDDEYGNVFIVTKKGRQFSFERMKVPTIDGK